MVPPALSLTSFISAELGSISNLCPTDFALPVPEMGRQWVMTESKKFYFKVFHSFSLLANSTDRIGQAVGWKAGWH